ncbi:MAG TPA: hypothetical protein VGC99_26385 [Candidatus Tectomicrobia bacterium]
MAKLQTLSKATWGILALALPSGLLALGIVATLDEYLPRLSDALARANWSALALEAGARWPELAGMLVGQLLLLAILVVGGRKALGSRRQA